MPTNQQETPPGDLQTQERQQRSARVRGHVLHALGQSPALYRLEVRPLWEAHYRVNVFVGADAISARLAWSYFLVTDDAGNVLTATPALTRLPQGDRHGQAGSD